MELVSTTTGVEGISWPSDANEERFLARILRGAASIGKDSVAIDPLASTVLFSLLTSQMPLLKVYLKSS